MVFNTEQIDGTCTDHAVECHVFHFDWQKPNEFPDVLPKLHMPYSFVMVSFDYGLKLYNGDQEPASYEKMKALFSMIKLILEIQADRPDVTSIFCGVNAKYIGECTKAMIDSGLVNNQMTQPTRELIWWKRNKYKVPNASVITNDHETYVLGWSMKEPGTLPKNFFKDWFGTKWPDTTILDIPNLEQRMKRMGKPVNLTENNPALAFLVHLKINTFIRSIY